MTKWQDYSLAVADDDTSKYPVLSICAAVVLMLLTPFTTSWLAAGAFAICLYRVIRYDARVFVTDYCILIPISALMKLGNGTPLAIYLCLIAAIWYFFRGTLKTNATTVLLIILMNYLLMRMPMNINGFVLLFGQMASMIVLLPKQDHHSAARAIKAFCVSLLFSCIYAYAFRNVSGLADLTGASHSPMWGTNLRRFCGLQSDPNYFTTLLLVGMSMLIKLKALGEVRAWLFWIATAVIALFGVLTYSKTFFLMFIFLIGIYVLWQFLNKKLIKGSIFTVLAVVALLLVFSMDNSPVAAVLNRLTSAQNLSDLTTSRSDVFALYFGEITENWVTFLFGKGMAADALYRDPHNIYLEIFYYVGAVGFILIIAVYISAFQSAGRMNAGGPKQHFLAKYSTLAVCLIIYLVLQGIFMQVFHGEMFLVALSFMLIPRNSERTDA